jgi:hypothetical protein
MTWKKGQRVAFKRADSQNWKIATIERVTRAGRAVIGVCKFGKNGFEIGKFDHWTRPSRIEPLDPESEASISFCDRSEKARNRLFFAVGTAESTLEWGTKFGTEAQVEAAERLADAIEAAILQNRIGTTP